MSKRPSSTTADATQDTDARCEGLQWLPPPAAKRTCRTSPSTAQKRGGGYEDFESVEKERVNAIIAQQCAHASSCGATATAAGIIVVLDASAARSTRALLAHGVAESRIHIVERNERVYEQLRALAPTAHVHCVDLFAFLANCTRRVHAIVADLMTPCLDDAQLRVLNAAVRRCKVQHVFITLCSRDGERRTVATRVEHVRAALTNIAHLALMYGYKRNEGATSMYVLQFAHKSSGGTVYRVRRIRELCGPHALVQWWGYPQRTDWTWERQSDIL